MDNLWITLWITCAKPLDKSFAKPLPRYLLLTSNYSPSPDLNPHQFLIVNIIMQNQNAALKNEEGDGEKNVIDRIPIIEPTEYGRWELLNGSEKYVRETPPFPLKAGFGLKK